MCPNIYMILSFIVIAHIHTKVETRESQTTNFNFAKNLVGVFFAPYTKFNTDKYDYTIEEVETMLEIISKRFQMVSTFNMGASAGRNDTEGTGLVPVAAGRLNKKLGRLAITVNIGIYQFPLLPDLKSGFQATKEANSLFPGTVTGMIITSFHTYTTGQLDEIMNLVKNNQIELEAQNLTIGTRTSNCKELLDKAVNNDPTTLELIQTLDQIICHVDPATDAVTVTTPAKAAEVIGMNLKTLEAGFRKFNPRFRLVTESGWPSKEKGKNGVDGSIKNMKEYWMAMNSICKENGIRADMWQAFDEPWKIEMAPYEPHYGWWTRVKNDSVLSTDHSAFAEKINYVEPYKVDWLLFGSIILGIIIIGTVLGVAYLVIRLKRIESQLLTKKDIDEFENGILHGGGEDVAEDALLLPYNRSYEILKSHFLIDRSKLLGSGAFGLVYKGKLENHANDVAFKMTQNNCTANNLKSLLSEIKIMIHVGKHENVVSIIGAYTAELRTGHVIIATELCDMGSLEKYLRSFKSTYVNVGMDEDGEAPRYTNAPHENGFNVNNFVRWSYEIACGMEHIGSKNVIHADLATRNVLLTRNKTAKITDFGLSRRLYEYTNYVKSNQEPLPWRWMAFESLTQMTFSTKSDAWAFGVTLWEIFSFADVPYPGLSWSLEFTDMLEKGLRMKQPGQASNEMYQIMKDCWDINATRRPNFTTLKECIGKYL